MGNTLIPTQHDHSEKELCAGTHGTNRRYWMGMLGEKGDFVQQICKLKVSPKFTYVALFIFLHELQGSWDQT